MDLVLKDIEYSGNYENVDILDVILMTASNSFDDVVYLDYGAWPQHQILVVIKGLIRNFILNELSYIFVFGQTFANFDENLIGPNYIIK